MYLYVFYVGKGRCRKITVEKANIFSSATPTVVSTAFKSKIHQQYQIMTGKLTLPNGRYLEDTTAGLTQKYVYHQ